MFSFFSDIKTILIIVLALAIIGLVIYLLIKFPNSKYFFIGLGCLLVLASGVFCGYADIQYFTAKGGIYGTVEDLINRNEIVQSAYEFDFKNLSLILTDGTTYSARITFTNEENLNVDCTNKALYVNKRPTNLSKKASNYIISEYGYTFYDEDIEELCSDYLTIKFSFEEKVTTCIISTSSGSSAAKYWNNYLKKNNFVVTIEDDTYQKDNSVNIDKATTSVLKYYINDELYQTTTYTVGEEIQLLEYEVEEGYLFTGWSEVQPTNEGIDLQNLTTYQVSGEAIKNFYGYVFKDNVLVVDYENKTDKLINIKIVDLTYSSIQGDPTSYTDNINEIFATGVLNQGTGQFVFNNETDWSPMTMILNNGECLSKISYSGYLVKNNKIYSFSNEKICSNDHAPKEFCNTTKYFHSSLINCIYYYQITIE